MAVGATNPSLIIDVKYDSQQSDLSFRALSKKTENLAKSHENKLKQIIQKGDLQRKLARDKFNDSVERLEKQHQDKMRRLNELANQKIVNDQKTAQTRMLANQNTWSSRMAKSLGTLSTAVKGFILVYSTMLLKNAVGNAFNYIDDLRKSSEALNLSIERLQVYNQMLGEAGSNAEKTAKIFDKLAIALDAATNGDTTKAKLFNSLGIETSDDIGAALDKIISKVKEGKATLTDLSNIFGTRMAAEVKNISLATAEYNTVRESMGKSLILEQQAKQIESFNDALSRVTLAIKIGFGRAFADMADGGAKVFDKLSKAISDINWEAVGNGILTIVRAFEWLGSIAPTVTTSLVYLKTSIEGAFAKFSLTPIISKMSDFIKASNKITLETLKLKRAQETAFMGLVEFYEYLEKTGKAVVVQTENVNKTALAFEKLMSAFNKIKTLAAPVISVFKVIGGYFSKIGAELAQIFPRLSKLFGFAYKRSTLLVLLFSIWDSFKAIKQGAETVQGIVYGFLSGWINLLDEITFKQLGIKNWFESFATWKTPKKVTAPEIVLPKSWDAYNMAREKWGAKDKSGKIISGKKFVPTKSDKSNPFDINEDKNTGEQSWSEKLAEQIAAQKKLRAETLAHIALLNDYKNKYRDNADVIKLVNEQLTEQNKILQGLNEFQPGNIQKLFGIQDKGFDLPKSSWDLMERLKESVKFDTVESNTIFDEIKNGAKELQDMRTKLGALEKLKGLFIDGSDEAKILIQLIEDLKTQLEETSGFEEIINSWNEWYSEWNEVVARTMEFFQGFFDAQTSAYNNQLEVLGEVIRLENERWDNANSRMEESGIKNTAYYVAQKKAHEKYVKDLEKREYELKAKAWDAEKESKVAGTIMNTAQGIMGAWAAGPIVGAIMSAIIAATGAMQLNIISGQKNPYRRNTGGWIPGTGYLDSQSALLTPGEFVINRNAAKENAQLLENINAGKSVGGNTTNVYVTIDGTIVGQSQWIEDELIPGINKALGKGYQLSVENN